MITLRENCKSVVRFARLAVSTACLLLLITAAANAQAPCTPVDITPPTDPALLVFEVEGKITSFNRTNRTITVNGMTFVIPSTVLVETRNLDLTGNITFEALTDPTAESQRSIIGGTVIASGDITFTPGGTGYCMSFSATRVFVEFAENVVVGLLSNVDVAAGAFRANGATIRMNTDARFPKEIIDLGGNPITLSDLAGFEGTDVTVNGYFDATQGVMFATLVESSAIKAKPGVDGVAITRAEHRADNRELRVEGTNTQGSQGQFAASVDIFSGGANSSGTDCVGTRLGSAPVSTVDGSWSFRQRNVVTNPGQVCAKSALGGVATRAVTN
ncbi:MAG TPA: hypothetical protein VKA70_18180 [Blastocatellia bacterium]|nr:hypothetical protein [Blastocatellia bacterium]